MSLIVNAFFDVETFSFSYVLVDPDSRACAIVDPVLNYDQASATSATRGAQQIVDFVICNDLTVEWILETHVHADHLSAASYLKSKFVCAQTGMGAGVCRVQEHFAARLNVGLPTDGRQFDRLFVDGERICIGHVAGYVMSTPGHTPACVCYVFDRFAIIGDTLFMPDSGTARCDFPGGDAATLYDSIQRMFELAPRTRLLMCHDYAPGGRTFQFMTSVADERTGNIHVRERISREEYIAMRTARDHDLAAPKLLDAALPFNMAGGLIAVESLRECWKRAAA